MTSSDTGVVKVGSGNGQGPTFVEGVKAGIASVSGRYFGVSTAIFQVQVVRSVIASVSGEIANGTTRYLAGIEFLEADQSAMQRLIDRKRKQRQRCTESSNRV
jgi:hypothetical protein